MSAIVVFSLKLLQLGKRYFLIYWQQHLFREESVPRKKKLGPLNAHPPKKNLHLRPCRRRS